VLMRTEPNPAPPTAIMLPSTARHRRPALTNVVLSNLIDKIHRPKHKYSMLLIFRYRMRRRHGLLPSPLAQRATNGVQ
jgi:hypothetical protein